MNFSFQNLFKILNRKVFVTLHKINKGKIMNKKINYIFPILSLIIMVLMESCSPPPNP